MTFIQDLAYVSFLGFPLIGYLGIVSYLSLLATATVSILTRRKIAKIPMRIHFRLAYLTLSLATVHAFLALVVYLF
ncbi:MAG TPA: hypothetical protein VJ869_07995 [Sphaerochaeta sp.]|nr:hypothetical protein [Sphaerochaeta sp.]